MKNAVLILLLGCLFCVVACKKSELEGTCQAEKDGKSWEASLWIDRKPENSCSDCISIVMSIYSPEGFIREELAFANVPCEEKRFDLQIRTLSNGKDVRAYSAFSNWIGHGDQVTSLYTPIINDPNSYVELTEIKGKCIKGKFQATLVLDPLFRDANPSLPDTVVFKNGVFEVN